MPDEQEPQTRETGGAAAHRDDEGGSPRLGDVYLEALGRLAPSLAAELRGTLHAAITNVEVARRALDRGQSARASEALGRVGPAIARLDEAIGGVLGCFECEWRDGDLSRLVRDLVTLIAPRARSLEVEIETSSPARAVALAQPPVALRRALLVAAAELVRDPHEPTIRLALTDRSGGRPNFLRWSGATPDGDAWEVARTALEEAGLESSEEPDGTWVVEIPASLLRG